MIRISDLKQNDKIIVVDDNVCLTVGALKAVHIDNAGLPYIRCRHGSHHIDSDLALAVSDPAPEGFTSQFRMTE